MRGRLGRKLRRDLRHLAPQLAAVAVTVAAGIAVFVALRAMHGWLRGAQARYYRDARFADVFVRAEAVPDAVVRRVAHLPGVAAVAGRLIFDVTLDVPGLGEPAVGRLVSLDAAHDPPVNRVVLRAGRWPAPGATAEAVASAAFAAANGLVPGDRVGAVLHGRWRTLHLVGLAQSPEFTYEIRGGTDLFPDSRRFGVLWVPRPVLASAFGRAGTSNDLALVLAAGARERAVLAGVDALLAPYGGTGAYGRADHVSHVFVSSEIDETAVTSVLLPAMFLGVTAFLLHLVLGRLVAMQREQVALLKAFGFGDATVGAHYLALALVPVGIGTAAGIAGGEWLAAALAGVYARFYQFPAATYAPDWGIAATAALVGAGIGALGALRAVRAAMRLPPAEAMRPPVPPRYRRGALERVGIARGLPPAVRVVTRQLGRHPLRAALAVTGIGLAVGLTIAVLFMFAAVARLRALAFELGARETVTVAFTRAQGRAAVAALRQLPGAWRVEPFRVLPVRFRHGVREARGAVQSVAPDAALRRLVAPDGMRRPPPRGGLVLAAALARKLGARAGDTLQVTVLAGRRATRRVPVAGTVEEVLGLGAYAAPDEMAALLGEPAGRLDGAWIAADPGAHAALAHALTRTPGIASSTFRAEALRGFDATIRQSFVPSLVTALAFALLITGGVIFNAARVALSERARELAGLRVLGFSQGEVAAMLLGEQGVLLALALPAGSVLGLGLCALIVRRMADTDVFRLPLFVSPPGHAAAWGMALAAGLGTGALVARRLARVSLVDVLKTRE